MKSHTAKCKLYLVPFLSLDKEIMGQRDSATDFLMQRISAALRAMEQLSRLSICMTEACLYAEIMELHPEAAEQIISAGASDRWFFGGSFWEEPWLPVVSEESFIRNIQYGRTYMQETFNLSCGEAILSDAAFIPERIPSLLLYCGTSGAVLLNSSRNKHKLKPSLSIGRWETSSGDMLPTVFLPGACGNHLSILLQNSLLWHLSIKKRERDLKTAKNLRFCQIGDLGNPFIRFGVNKLLKFSRQSRETITIGGADRFFCELDQRETETFPVFSGHFENNKLRKGNIAPPSELLHLIRETALTATAAETAATVASLQVHTLYPKAALQDGWRLLFSAQGRTGFSNTAGSGLYEQKLRDLKISRSFFSGIFDDSIHALSRQLPLRKGEDALFIFNTASTEREESISVNIPLSASEQLKLEGPKGEETAFKITDRTEESIQIVCTVKLPPLGWSSWKIIRTPQQKTASKKEDNCYRCNDMQTEQSFPILEDDQLQIHVTKDGIPYSILDKNTGKEFLASPLVYEIITANKSIISIPEMQSSLSWKAPHSRCLEIHRECEGSRFIHRISLEKLLGKSVLVFRDTIYWKEHNAALRLNIIPRETFSLQVGTGFVGASTERGSADIQQPAVDWADACFSEDSSGLGLLFPGVFLLEKCTKNRIQTRLVQKKEHQPTKTNQYKGQNSETEVFERRYALLPHTEKIISPSLHHLSQCFVLPLKPYLISRTRRAIRNHKSHPAHFSLASVSPAHMNVSALKFAENDQTRLIIRIVEHSGRETKNVRITFDTPIINAHEVDGLELPLRTASFTGSVIYFSC
ncbi:MAG: hypothetical protein PF495_14830, partial [Spirochaetales bacterium]|nr:hypothetical protein [Spirochaetales bacterium]